MINRFCDDYSFLSNFYPCKILFDGVEYPSLEYAFQAAKTFDENERMKILAAATSGKAKRLGHTVTLRKDWEEVKHKVMLSLLFEKFKHPELLDKLLKTGDEELIEGNFHGDKVWGVCLKTNVGQNHLGRLLMYVREKLRPEQ